MRTLLRKRPTLLASVLMLVVFMAAQHLPATVVLARTEADDLPIYSETALTAPWENYSYNSTIDFAGATAQQGTTGVAVTHTNGFGAFSVNNPTPLVGSEYSAIRFWGYGAAGGSQITLSLGDNPTEFADVTLTANTWTQYTVLLSALGNPASFSRINWQDATGAAQATYYLDEIVVVGTSDAPTFPDATSDGTRTLEPGPSGVAVAPNGRIYAAVYQDGRVYSWANVAALTGGGPADLTFGSANGDPDGATGCTNGPTATIMCGPESVAVDSAGNLFVADTYNHRVLIFLNPDTDATPLVADGVLGQANLTSGVADFDSVNNDGVLEGFCFVRGLAVDASNRLWVVDEFNYRVVRFDTPLVSGSLPSRVFGQADLNSGATGCTAGPSGNSGADKFSLPLGVAVDSTGVLYVSDLGNNRVQRFAADAANGAAAAASYVGLNQPHDVAVDRNNNLYIADTLNGQMLAYAGGATGDLVADQTYPGRTFPMGMAFTANNDLLVADCGAPLENSTYPPCLRGPRGVYFYAAPQAPQNQPPVATDDEVQTTVNEAVSGNVLTNDSDPQGSALTVTNFQQPGLGSVIVEPNGIFTFTPQADIVGETLFTYVVSNAFGLTDQGTVTIIITDTLPPPPPPDNALFLPTLAR